MINSDNVAIIGALALAGAAITLGMSDSKPIIENWGGNPQMAVKAIPSYAANRAAAQAGQIFAAPPSLQAMLPPRFNSVGLPASITYNLPAEKNLASRVSTPFAENVAGNRMHTALGFGTATATATGTGATATATTGAPLRENFTRFDSTGSGRMDQMELNTMEPSLLVNVVGGGSDTKGKDPVFPNTVGAGDAGGADNADNPVIFDRFITANLSSRLRSQADKIRGDLAIPPCNSGWFQVSVNPAVDLEPGALAVMGGIYNEQCQSISSLVNMASGGTKTAIGGVDMSAAIDTCLAGAGNDVTAIAFP